MNRTIEAVMKLSAKLGSVSAFDKLSGKMADVDKKAKAYNRSQGAIGKKTDEMHASMVRYAASGAALYGAYNAFTDPAALERRLTRIGINADETKERMDRVMDDMRQIAQDAHAPIENVVSGLENLIASGKSLDEALALLPSVAKTAQASGSAFGETATTADALASSFGIANDEMERSFDILSYYGKAGKFELKDMAAELPSLAPAFAALGYEGEEALTKLTVALQIVRKETGSSGEAATAFMDVLTKMESNTMANNFSKMGVDLRKEMDDIRASGEDLLEGFIRISTEAVDGDLSKLPQLFTDKQMLIGMRALISRTGEYKDLLEEVSGAIGTVNKDIKRIGEDGQASIDRMTNAWDQFKTSLGESIAPVAIPALDAASDFMSKDKAITTGMKRSGKSFGDITYFNASRLIGGTTAEERNYWAGRGGYSFRNETGLGSGRGLTAGDIKQVPRSEFPLPAPRGGYAPPVISGGLSLPASAPDAFPRKGDAARMQLRNMSDEDFLKLDASQAAAEIEQSGSAVEQGGKNAAGEIVRAGTQAGANVADSAISGLISGAVGVGAAIGEAAASRLSSVLGSIDAAAGRVEGATRQAEGAAGRRARRQASGNPGSTMTDAGAVE